MKQVNTVIQVGSEGIGFHSRPIYLSLEPNFLMSQRIAADEHVVLELEWGQWAEKGWEVSGVMDALKDCEEAQFDGL